MTTRNTQVIVGAIAMLITQAVQADTLTKANNTTALNATGSWTNGVVPGTTDAALWNSIVPGANISALGGSMTWGQISIANPGGLIKIANTAGAVLTLNGLSGTGIDMSAATQSLTIYNHITLGASQTWDVGSRTLDLGEANAYTNAAAAGVTLTKIGAGGVVARAANFTTFAGKLVVNAGTWQSGNNIGTVNVTLNNGMLADYYRATTIFTGGLGEGNNQIQVYGDSGFGGGNGNSTFRIGASLSTLQWGSTYFNPTTLKFRTPMDNSGPTTFGQITFDNGLDLNGGERTIYVLGGTGATAVWSCWAKINGVVKDLAGGATLVKTGGGTLNLANTANTFAGMIKINQGAVQFAAAGSIGGSGRTVSVTNNAIVSPTYAINNVFLNRLQENTNAFIIALGATSSNPLDLDSSTGADLENASLGAAAALIYSGTLTPNNNIYRLGGGSNTLTVSSAITGVARSLVVKGNVTLSGTIDYGGNTTVNFGTLQMNSLNTCAEAGKIVTIAPTSATLNLNFTGTNTVEQLFIGTTEKAKGLYGAGGTALPQITGIGTLNVVGLPPSGTMTVID